MCEGSINQSNNYLSQSTRTNCVPHTRRYNTNGELLDTRANLDSVNGALGVKISKIRSNCCFQFTARYLSMSGHLSV